MGWNGQEMEVGDVGWVGGCGATMNLEVTYEILIVFHI